jgi:acyl homoserine lactone synthase
MIITLTTLDRSRNHPAFEEMFRARAKVFHQRLGWAVNVVEGLEIDTYDDSADPVYLLTQNLDGRFTGSLRLLPTTGDTMLRNEFKNMFDNCVDVSSPLAWECTRFCVHPSADKVDRRTASIELLDGLCKLALRSGIEQIVGVYGSEMIPVYRRIGWSPDPFASSRPEFGNLYVGIWTVSEAISKLLGEKLAQSSILEMPTASFSQELTSTVIATA